MSINVFRWVKRILDYLGSLFRRKKYVQVYVCDKTGKLGGNGCKTHLATFEQGKEPTEVCKACEPPPQIVVKVCLDSEQQAREFCPRVEEKSFVVGTEPTELCKLHTGVKPMPKPPFIGGSCYQGDRFALEDVCWFSDQIAENGGNLTERFTVQSWFQWEFQPYVLRDFGYRDPGYPDKLFALTKWRDEGGVEREGWNEEFWAKRRAMWKHDWDNGIVTVERLLDFCSLKRAWNLHRYPFRANKERLVDGWLTGGLWGDKILAGPYRWLCEKIVDEFAKAGVPFYFLSVWNEGDVVKDSWTDEEADRRLLNQFCYLIDVLTHLEKPVPVERIIVNVSRVKVLNYLREYKETSKCLTEIHGVNSPESLEKAIRDFGVDGLFPNGDGPDAYARGRAGDAPHKREPSVDQARCMGQIMREKGVKMYAYFLRSIESDPNNVHIRQAEGKFDVLRALREGYGG